MTERVKGKAGPKRKSKWEREQALAETARLSRMGYTQWQIAEKLGVSGPQVHYDQQIIKKRYAETQLGSRAELVNEKLSQLEDVCKEAAEAYEQSKLPAKKVVEERAPEWDCPVCDGEGWVIKRRKAKPTDIEGDGLRILEGVQFVEEDKLCFKCEGRGVRGGVIKVTEQTEERLPANEYLTTILNTVKQGRELLGLDAPKKVDMRAAVAQVSWEQLCLDLPPAEVPDPAQLAIEAVIQGILPSTAEIVPESNGDGVANVAYGLKELPAEGLSRPNGESNG